MNLKLQLFITAASAAITVSACAPYFQPSYMVPGNGYRVSLNKKAAIKRFLEINRDLLPSPFTFPVGTKNKLDSHRMDIEAAMRKHFPDLPEDKFAEMRKRYVSFVDNRQNSPEIGLKEYPELPAELDEFKLYLEGFEELHAAPDLATVPEAWQKLLALPPERRHFRTAWVHFILGNHFKADCHTHYDNCRNAVRAGFADSQGVALRSYTLEIRYGKNPVRLIRRAAEAELSNSHLEFLETIDQRWINSLTAPQYISLLEDPLCLEFLALMDTSDRFNKMIGSYPLRSADIRACHAYRKGDMKLARKYISMIKEPTLLSVYIEAKLARHTGNTFLGVKKLRQWLKMAEKATQIEKESLVNVYDEEYNINAEKDVYGLLGSAMVMRHDFLEAAEFFYRANSDSDLNHILERFFTLDEAEKFVATLGDSKRDKIFKYLVSRRAFRENNFDLAARYMPGSEQQNLKNYIAFMEKGNNRNLDPNTRAIALYNAAKILRYHGMELAGTQEAPDFFPGYFGSPLPYDGCKECRFNKITGTWTLCREHWQWHRGDSTFAFPGFNAPHDYSTVPPSQRYHYRHKAAQLAMKAGRIAEDDDLRAVICIFGGNCMRKTSTPEADIFYKMLVNECKGSLLSKLADKQRWFPVTCVPMNKEVNHSTPLQDLNAVKTLIREIFPSN